ncbi:MAG: endolytic transglycosylase MltG, partial [Acidimicrobiales bacterium]
VLVLVVVGGGLAAWYEFQAHPLGGPGRSELVTVANEESTGSVISALAARGVISSSFAFRLGDLVHGTPTVQPGEYQFRQNSTFGAVRQVLARGPNVFTLEVTPGLTLSEVERRVGELPIAGSFADALKSGTVTSAYAVPDRANLEGTIAAGEYTILPGETSIDLLHQMVERFNQQAAAAHLVAAAGQLGYSPAQLVIIASIVEKEGVYAKNMGKVSRVIYNRLAKGTPLQMDATVLYSIGQDGGTVTPADLKLPTPYNTYLHTGLPPTAICTPSATALAAAADPTPGGWLYFELVSKDGTEQFSDTFAEQLAAEQLARSQGLP